jgi:hypothetical protein
VAIVDPHQVHPTAIGPKDSAVRTWIERVRADVKKAAGVDLAFDVDKIAVTPTLVVMSGRFDGDKLASNLADYKYTKADYDGRTYLVRPGEDAVMAVGDDTLVYGDEASIKAAVDAKNGTSLLNNQQVVDRLARIGWNQPLLGTVQMGGDRPSLRAMITGSTGPRAVTFGATGGQGVSLRVSVETATPSTADELAKLLDEKRAGAAEALPAMLGPSLAPLVAQAARDATVRSDPAASQVLVNVHVPSEALDAMAHAASTSEPLGELFKTLRLYQLLAPTP